MCWISAVERGVSVLMEPLAGNCQFLAECLKKSQCNFLESQSTRAKTRTAIFLCFSMSVVKPSNLQNHGTTKSDY